MSEVVTPAQATEVQEEVWVRFSVCASNRGCGNYDIYAIGTAMSKRGNNPWAPARSWERAQHEYKLSEVMAKLERIYKGRELTLTFARYPFREEDSWIKEDQRGPDGRLAKFEGHEFMQLLEKHPNARRMTDWLNTNHNPPSHLRSYVIVFHGSEVSQYGKDLV